MVYVNKDIYITLIDIPTLLDVRTYGDRLLIVFDRGEMHRFIVVIYNSEHIINEIPFLLLMFNKT
jgi:hypothetical protein